MSTAIMVGCDPEMFVSEGHHISHAIGRIGGDKNNPLSVPKGGLQEDNVLAEFCMDPADTSELFMENISTVMACMRDRLSQSGLKVVTGVSSYTFKDMSEMPEKAFEFGCDPDFDALTGEANPRPNAAHAGLRTAGGHVHIGYPSPTPEVSQRIALMCDYTLGLNSVIEDTTKGSRQRKELYGKASCVRWKSYGLEYRTLSSYWLWKKDYQALIFERAKWSAENHHLLEQMQATLSQDDVRGIINRGDKAAAKSAISLLKLAIEGYEDGRQ